MTILSSDINKNLTSDGSTVNATVCPGIHTWQVTSASVSVNAKASLELSCCGAAHSCIIDGEGLLSKTRTNSLFVLLRNQVSKHPMQQL
jgi:hypothetical protein